MTIHGKTFPLLIGLMLTMATLWSVPGMSEESAPVGAEKEAFTLDPAISGGQNAPYRPSAPPAVKIEKNGNQTNLQIETEGQVSPYVSTIEPGEVPEELRHLVDTNEQNALKNYRLETGVGVQVGENTDFNFGYRFDTPPSLLDRTGPDSSNQSGQFRFGLDFKLPSK